MPLQKERLMFIFRLGQEVYSGGHGLGTHNGKIFNSQFITFFGKKEKQSSQNLSHFENESTFQK